MTVTLAPVGSAEDLGQHGMVLAPQLILRDKIGCVVGLTAVPQQQPQSQMPSVTYAISPSWVSFRVEPPTSLAMLVSVMVYVFSFSIPM